jgi:glycosyltransferase involved in cell wall biosynthesis
MVESSPLISVVVAVYNGKSTLQECIDSFIRQTYPNKELMVIDGASKDGTVEVIHANQHHFSYWLSEPDRGIYNAWNKALPHAQGDWISFLGADDFFWNDQVLSNWAEQLAHVPQSVRVAYSRIMMLDNQGKPLYQAGMPWDKIKNRFKHTMCIPHPGVMHRRELFSQHGRFDESFRIAADYELLLRELLAGEARFVPEVISVGMRQGGISSVAGNLWLGLSEIRRAQAMHGLIPPWSVRLGAYCSVLLRLMLVKTLGEDHTVRLINWSKRVRQ